MNTNTLFRFAVLLIALTQVMLGLDFEVKALPSTVGCFDGAPSKIMITANAIDYFPEPDIQNILSALAQNGDAFNAEVAFSNYMDAFQHKSFDDTRKFVDQNSLSAFDSLYKKDFESLQKERTGAAIHITSAYSISAHKILSFSISNANTSFSWFETLVQNESKKKWLISEDVNAGNLWLSIIAAHHEMSKNPKMIIADPINVDGARFFSLDISGLVAEVPQKKLKLKEAGDLVTIGVVFAPENPVVNLATYNGEILAIAELSKIVVACRSGSNSPKEIAEAHWMSSKRHPVNANMYNWIDSESSPGLTYCYGRIEAGNVTIFLLGDIKSPKSICITAKNGDETRIADNLHDAFGAPRSIDLILHSTAFLNSLILCTKQAK